MPSSYRRLISARMSNANIPFGLSLRISSTACLIVIADFLRRVTFKFVDSFNHAECLRNAAKVVEFFLYLEDLVHDFSLFSLERNEGFLQFRDSRFDVVLNFTMERI